MRKKFLITYNVSIFYEYLLDLYFITDTLEEIELQIDDHFSDCYPLVHESLIKNRHENPYTFKIYELSEVYSGVRAVW